jgi:hypothetical protein
MIITLEATKKVVEYQGIEVRVWEGRTASGIEVHAFIPRIKVPDTSRLRDVINELQHAKDPSPLVKELPIIIY